MTNRICKFIKMASICIVAISSTVGIAAFILERFEPKSKVHRPYGIYEKYVKRPLDAFLATGAGIVLSPVMIVVAVLVKIKLGSPVLFKQERPGRDEKIFKLYKFRSMTNQHDKDGNLLSDDERLTQFGRMLRSTSLDELPELINIIRGDMSVVGPRPLLIEYLPYYSFEEKRRHDVRPGLTGLAQVNGRNAISWDRKLQYDIEYVPNITFWGDMKIIFETFIKTIKRSDIQIGSSFKAGKFIDQRIERGQKGLI